MNTQPNKDNSSGSIRVEDNKIYWDYKGQNIFSVEKENIVVIGEYTNSNGPYFDDWFITFVTKDGHWQSIPWYADNIDKLEKFLCDHFQPDFNVSYLPGSTEWNSVVRYPESLKEKPLFKLIPTEKYMEPKTFFDKLLFSVGLGSFDTTQYVELADEVKNVLAQVRRIPTDDMS